MSRFVVVLLAVLLVVLAALPERPLLRLLLGMEVLAELPERLQRVLRAVPLACSA